MSLNYVVEVYVYIMMEKCITHIPQTDTYDLATQKTTFFSGDINPTKIIAANKYTILFICVDCEAFLVAQDYSNNDEK